MIDMGVSDEDLFQLHAVLFDGAQDIVEIATWVDDGGFVGRCAPQDGAGLLQRRDRDDHASQTGIGMLFFTHDNRRNSARSAASASPIKKTHGVEAPPEAGERGGLFSVVVIIVVIIV